MTRIFQKTGMHMEIHRQDILACTPEMHPRLQGSNVVLERWARTQFHARFFSLHGEKGQGLMARKQGAYLWTEEWGVYERKTWREVSYCQNARKSISWARGVKLMDMVKKRDTQTRYLSITCWLTAGFTCTELVGFSFYRRPQENSHLLGMAKMGQTPSIWLLIGGELSAKAHNHQNLRLRRKWKYSRALPLPLCRNRSCAWKNVP
jgi:hypothetical protein